MARRADRRAARQPPWWPTFVALLSVCGCGTSTKAEPTGGSDGSAGSGGRAGRGGGAATGGTASGSGGSGSPSTGGSAAVGGCDANRGAGIPLNSGTLSASVDGRTLSGGGTILWAAGTNTLTLSASDGSTLVVVFPGCAARAFSLPSTGPAPDAISVTYTGSGGDPQWACTYEDADLGPATCMVNVTAYGENRNAPVTGTFQAVARLRHAAADGGRPVATKTVSAGTFTFGRP